MIKYEEKNTIEWFIIIIKTLFLMLFRFFTIWGLFILLLYYLGPLKKFQYSILYILITISLGAIYLVYINPKRLTIPYLNYHIQGRLLRIVDILFHHLPLLLFLVTYDNTIKRDNLLFYLIIVSSYLLIINPFYSYNLNLRNVN
jgi:hypothetical protein